jgi:putative phosphoesterase
MPAVELGLISDTHGLLRPEALAALRGCAEILHAGDVGDPAILEALAALAPVHAVRGNVDLDAPLSGLPATWRGELAGVRIVVHHVREEVRWRAGSVDVVVYGHTHRPLIEARDGVLWVNPGSAGPRRFDLPVTLARLVVGDGPPRARHVHLLPATE